MFGAKIEGRRHILQALDEKQEQEEKKHIDGSKNEDAVEGVCWLQGQIREQQQQDEPMEEAPTQLAARCPH